MAEKLLKDHNRDLIGTVFKSQRKNIGPYEIQKLVEKGTYSKIYLAKSIYTKEEVIVKEINKSSLKKELDELLLITKQIQILKILKHRNIITLY